MSMHRSLARDRHLFAVICAVSSTLTAAVAYGQSTTAQSSTTPAESQGPAPADSGSINDVVVTARRTEERLSDVPVAVEALSEQELTERRIFSESDLQAATPGLTVRQTNSSNQISFSLRGQSLDAFSFASPAVLNYVNEFNAQSTSASAFYDLQSIQVLKGPQGTLFGRNATGGAVLYETRKPDGDSGGYLRVSYGNLNSQLAEGAINFPGTTMSARLAGQYQKRDGYQHNLLLGTRNASLDSLSLRPTILLDVGALKNVTVYQYTATGGTSAGLRATNYYGVNGSTGAAGNPLNNFVNGQPYDKPLGYGLPSATLYPDGISAVLEDGASFAPFGFTGLPSFIAAQENFGFYDIFNNQTGKHRARQHLVTNTTTYDFGNDSQLKNIFGYNRSRSRDRTDVDGTPFEPLNIGFGGATSAEDFGDPGTGGPTAEGYTYLQRQLSDELQLSGKLGRISYISGLYHFEGKDYQRLPLTFAPDYSAALGDNLGAFLREYTIESKSDATYAQLTYALTPTLNLTAGGRYTWEKTDYTPADRVAGSYDIFLDDFNTGLGIGPSTLKAHKPSWSVSLDYKLNDDVLIYFAHRGSWRTGGFNGTAASTDANGQTVPNVFKPEATYDFEVGTKFNGMIGDAPANLNVAVYDQHIKDVVRAIYLGVAAVSGNVDKARVTGVEADASIRPTDWLEIGGNMAYTDARYTKNTAVVGNTVVVFGPYGDVPKWSGAAFTKFQHNLQDGSTMSFRGDIYKQSSFFYSNAANTILPQTQIKGYSLIDLRLEWAQISKSNLSATAYVKNLTDKKYNVGGFALGAVNAINAVLPGLPRLYGLELSYEY